MPDSVENRQVISGRVGCPACGREYPIIEGALHFGAEPEPTAAESSLAADALVPLLGLSGPGGYLALVGVPGALVEDLAQLLPGVHLVAADPTGATPVGEAISCLRGGGLACQASSMRGVVLGPGPAGDSAARQSAARAVLPGRHIVGEGPEPGDLAVAASAAGVWVATSRGTGDPLTGGEK